ncbi:STIV orfB116 family protein [Fusobacterium necrophorum]|uniref:STIV orfB116 family protein n=1 Tax=Fusobacterium necrophorum TaxID=859 RepID=UPI00370F3C75
MKELLERVSKIEELGLSEKIELVKELISKSEFIDAGWDGDDVYTTVSLLAHKVTLYSTHYEALDPHYPINYDLYRNFCKRIINVEVEAIEEEVIQPLALLNTSICTTCGTYKLVDLTLEQAKELVAENKDNLLSAIGHDSTAEIMSEILEVPVLVNRIQFTQEAESKALVFKILGRAKEGQILDRAAVEEIGYKFQLLERLN